MAIAGQPGLFKMVSEGKNSIIVESLVTGKKMPAYSSAKISAIEDIAIFTDEAEVPLVEVFKSISAKEDGGQSISHKSSSNDLKAYFKEILPNYDEYRVYVSDMKKVFQWYNTLQAVDMLTFDEAEASSETEETKEA